MAHPAGSVVKYSDGTVWGAEQAFGQTWVWNLGTGDGEKKVYVQFKDSAGNWSQSYPFTLILDTTAPVLKLSTLSNGTYTNDPTLNVFGTVSDVTTGVKTLAINGTAVTVENGTFSYALTLSSGANVITTIATDYADNAATDIRTIILDTTAPTTTANPTGGAYYGSVPGVTLSADEQATIYYTTNTTDPTVSSSVYIAPIPIAATTTLKFFARDVAGNEEAVKTQVYDITPVMKGDVNGNRAVDLADAILAMQVLSRVKPAQLIYKEADVNGDAKIGLQEVIYILQKVAGMR
jgi:hypothetical protein